MVYCQRSYINDIKVKEEFDDGTKNTKIWRYSACSLNGDQSIFFIIKVYFDDLSCQKSDEMINFHTNMCI